MTQVRESLRPLWAIVFVAGLVSTAHASLFPQDAAVYFSTNTPGRSFGNGFHLLRPGDALSTSGKVAMSNRDLVKNFDPTAGKGAGFGLDGLQVFQWVSGDGVPQVYFSTDKSFYSRSLGQTVGDGDLLNKQGQIVATNQQLLAAFEPSRTAGLGLDAFDVLDPAANQQIWFSTAKGFHSDKLGQDIGPGDVLSNTGQVIATNADLLKAFQPAGNDRNYGLDALYVVDAQAQTPVIWFSTTKGFYSDALDKKIGAGDLLSSDGAIVATNRELMSKFGFRLPFGNAGLDAFSMLRKISDDGRVIPPPPPGTPEPVTLALVALAVPMILLRRRT